ncbi:MAG: 30S ribosomal protein S6 [Candidatus Paceibacterota bacterium]
MEEKDVKNYEIGFLVKDENDANEIIKIVSDYKANIINESQVKRFLLAYPIKKETSACFGYISFSMPPSDIIKVNDALKINSKILRFLITIPVITGAATPYPSRPTKRITPVKPMIPMQPIKKAEPIQNLSNEALEKKLEEILK